VTPSSLPYLSRRIFDTVHVITARKAAEIVLALQDRLGIQVQIPLERLETNRPPERTARAAAGDGSGAGFRGFVWNGIGVIPIDGTIVQRASGMDAMSGLVGINQLAQSFRAALADPRIDGILLDVSSEGGEVPGTADFADEIFAARKGEKPVWAIANEAAMSGAYWIASAASRLVLPRTALVGSVGAFTMHVNRAGLDAAMGLEITYIAEPEAKVAGNPHAPLPDEVRAKVQASIKQVVGLFNTAVARNRGLPVDQVRGWDAGIARGDKAVALGMADAIETFDSALRGIRSDANTRRKGPAPTGGGRAMGTRTGDAADAGGDREHADGGAAAMTTAEVRSITEAAEKRTRTETLARVTHIQQFAEVCVRDPKVRATKIAAYVQSELPLDQVRSELLLYRAQQADAAAIASRTGNEETKGAYTVNVQARAKKFAAEERERALAQGGR
jgi:ClpP class serine protease